MSQHIMYWRYSCVLGPPLNGLNGDDRLLVCIYNSPLENSPGCGGSIFSDSNGGTFPVITGPFPMQCVWTIRAPQGQLAIFRMFYLNIGGTYTCDDWGLEVWEPSAPNYTLIATRCNGVYEDYFTSRKNELLVKIHSKRDLSFFYSFFYYSTESELCYG